MVTYCRFLRWLHRMIHCGALELHQPEDIVYMWTPDDGSPPESGVAIMCSCGKVW